MELSTYEENPGHKHACTHRSQSSLEISFQGPEKHSEEPTPRPVGNGSSPRTPAPGLLQVSKGPRGECLGPVSLWLSSKLRAQCLRSG